MVCKATGTLVVSLAVCALMNGCVDRETIAGTGREPPDRMVGVNGNFQEGRVLSTLPIPLRVRILSAQGRPVRGIGVLFLDPSSSASFSDTIARSDGDGYASTRVTLGTKAESVFVYARVSGLKGSPVKFSLNTLAHTGVFAQIQAGDHQMGLAGEFLPNSISVKVVDAYANPVADVSALFTTQDGSIATPLVATSRSGIATARWRLDTIAGPKTATVTFPMIPELTLQFTATALGREPVKITAMTNKDVHALSGQSVPGGIKVKLTDRYGNPASATVRFAVVEGEPTQLDTSRRYPAGNDGTVTVPITLGYADSVTRVYAYTPENSLVREFFKFTHYRYTPLDSLRSSAGTVEVFWERNLNRNFSSYTVERCAQTTFSDSVKILAVITDESTTTFTDGTAPVGTMQWYRVRLDYRSGFFFTTNIRNVSVMP